MSFVACWLSLPQCASQLHSIAPCTSQKGDQSLTCGLEHLGAQGVSLLRCGGKPGTTASAFSPNADQARPISIHSAHRGTLPHVAFEIQDTFVLRLRTQRDQTRPHKTIKTATKEICGDSLTGSDVLVSRLGNTAQDVRSSLFPKWPCGKPGE